MADILREPRVTPVEEASKGSWSDWIAGAVWERSLLEMLARAGFAEARVHRRTGYRTSSFTQWRWYPRPGQVPEQPCNSAAEMHQVLGCPRRPANRVE